jgi:hypothetical protein
MRFRLPISFLIAACAVSFATSARADMLGGGGNRCRVTQPSELCENLDAGAPCGDDDAGRGTCQANSPNYNASTLVCRSPSGGNISLEECTSGNGGCALSGPGAHVAPWLLALSVPALLFLLGRRTRRGSRRP